MAQKNTGTIYNEQSLYNCIKLFFPELEFDQRDLKNPTVTFVLNFYSAFLIEIGVDVYSLNQIQISQMREIQNVDMYNQTIPCLNVYQAVSYFMSNIGVNDFCFSDMVNPTPKRTIAHMSAIMHFLEYCDDAVNQLNPKLDKVLSLCQKKEELLSKIETVKKDINQRATNRVKRAENMEELKNLMEKEKQKLDELFKEKEIQKQAMEGVKKLALQDEEKEKEYAEIIKKAEEEIEKLNNMIVKSPEKLKNELQQLTEKKEECDELVKSLKSTIEEKKKLTNVFVNETEEQELRYEKLHELLEIENSIGKLNRQLESIRKNCLKHEEDVVEVKQQISNLLQKNKNLKANLEDVKLRKEKQNQENKDLLAVTEKEYSDLMLKKEEQIEHANQIQRKINEIHEDMKKLKLKMGQDFEYIVDVYQSLEAKELEIKDNYDKIIEAVKQRNRRLLEDDS